jgi:release factor glutamine methyltransferase
MTLDEWLGQSEARLREGPHPERARRDAEVLLLHKIGKNKAWLMAHAGDEFAGCTAIGYAALVERRQKGEPIQYITGEAEFYGLPFRVTRDVLIPRPETEHLVERTLEMVGAPSFPRILRKGRESNQFESPPTSCRILDIGTGCGAIAVALAAHLPKANVTATDISDFALAIARENASRNHVADRIRFLKGDLLAPLAGEQFDIIVSNPPYVPETDQATLSVEVREFEPALALFAGDDGLDIYRRLIPCAFDALVPGGFIVFEIGYGQQEAVRNLLSSAGFSDVGFVADLQGIPRVAHAQRN